jgi:hypothetical protein
MPCPACIVALMGTDGATDQPAGMSTVQKVALAGAGLALLWFMWPVGLKPNSRRRRSRRRR